MTNKTQTATTTHKTPRLGVNIDHVATLRQARGVQYPSPLTAAQVCYEAGAEGITIHLREDRRHIQDHDVYDLKEAMNNCLNIPMNLEMATTAEMVAIACDVLPEWVCLVPEKREELTTEGGLDVCSQRELIGYAINKMHAVGIKISLFIDANSEQIDASIQVCADAIEIHTGQYAEATLNTDDKLTQVELQRIIDAVAYAQGENPQLIVNAGHGLTRDNVAAIAKIKGIHELNIGHALIADAVFMGLEKAVKAMKEAMQ